MDGRLFDKLSADGAVDGKLGSFDDRGSDRNDSGWRSDLCYGAGVSSRCDGDYGQPVRSAEWNVCEQQLQWHYVGSVTYAAESGKHIIKYRDYALSNQFLAVYSHRSERDDREYSHYDGWMVYIL